MNESPPDPPDTRTRLLQTALAAFGHRDFDAVSVREIVERAGANIAAVSYHFGGKQGLYLATAEFLADRMQARLGPVLGRIRDAAAGADAVRGGELLRELIGALARQLLDAPFGDDATGFILREQHQPTAAFDVLYERLMYPVQQTFQALVGRIVGEPAPPQRELVLVTHALIGQIIAFRMARTTVLRRLGQADLGPDDVAEITGLIVRLSLDALQPLSRSPAR